MPEMRTSSPIASRTPHEPRNVHLGYETALSVLFQLPPSILRAGKLQKADPMQPAPRKPDLLRAEAQLNALLPCPPEKPLHIMVGAQRCRPVKPWHIHRSSVRIRGASQINLAEHLLIPTAPAVLVQMATRLPFAQLVELGFRLCGTYRSGAPSTDTIFDQHPLTTSAQLSAFIGTNPHLAGARRAQRALAYISDGSASPRETQTAILLALPMRLGGYGLGSPLMNHKLPATREARSIAGRRSFRCDLFWKDAKLDVEYQSQEFHSNERSRINDSRRANALRAMGCTVVSITNDELDSIAAMDVIAASIAKSRGKQFRITVERYRERQIELRRQLKLPIAFR